MPGDVGFQRKLVQQRLAEGVDRLYLQSARRFESARKQPPRLMNFRNGWALAFDRFDSCCKGRIIERCPFGQAFEHPVRHFGGGCLRVGQAENGRWPAAGEQQPDDALRQYMRFA